MLHCGQTSMYCYSRQLPIKQLWPKCKYNTCFCSHFAWVDIKHLIFPCAQTAYLLSTRHNLAGEEAECGGPGLAWWHVVYGCEASWMYCQSLLEMAHGSGQRLWRAISMPTACSLKTCDFSGIVLTAHFTVAFYCDQPKAHLCNEHTVQSASCYATPKICVHRKKKVLDILFQLPKNVSTFVQCTPWTTKDGECVNSATLTSELISGSEGWAQSANAHTVHSDQV